MRSRIRILSRLLGFLLGLHPVQTEPERIIYNNYEVGNFLIIRYIVKMFRRTGFLTVWNYISPRDNIYSIRYIQFLCV